MPQPGDHSWVIAIAYIAVSAAALLARRVSSDAAERSFWGIAALMMLAFGLAKGLRLQGIATNWIRTEARTHQLYDYRKLVEYPFVIAVLGAALFVGWQSRGRIFRRGRIVATAVLTALALIAFLLVRAASVHAIDPLMYKPILGVSAGWWAELLLLFLFAATAIASIRERRSK